MPSIPSPPSITTQYLILSNANFRRMCRRLTVLLVPFGADDGDGEGSTVVPVGEVPVVVVAEVSVPLPGDVVTGAEPPVVVVGVESVPLPAVVVGGMVGPVVSVVVGAVVVGDAGDEPGMSSGVAPGVVLRATKALQPLIALVSRLTVEVPLPPQDE